ncbi:MAG: ABC transporter permease [Lachnospiraceae bacterium]|nr:ABC transporter permease [Lachnospiraceae bacterium]
MNSKKTAAEMIFLMSKKSLKSSRMRNIFVMITIFLASSLLMVILMFAVGQKQREKNEVSKRQHAGYYNLTDTQVKHLKNDNRIAYQIQIKTGILSQMDGFDLMPYYVSELSDQIQIGELQDGRMPETEKEIALQGAMLKKMGIKPAIGSSVTLTFYDGSTETFNVSGILKGDDTAKQFSVFFSGSYAENGSQLKDVPYEIYVKLDGADAIAPEDCREVIYQIGKDAGIERKYINPSKAFIDSLSLDMQSVMIYGLVGTVILLACVLVIYGVFYLSVIDRIHQFGQLRAIGMTKKQIHKFVFREGNNLFLRSAPIGLVIGGIAGYFMIPDGFTLWHTLWIIILVFMVIYVVTMISIQKPAHLAAAIPPVEALRYVAQDGMKKEANKKMCRKLTPLGLGIMNFSKNKKKAVITMLSLTFGGILFMTAATYMSSFDKAGYARQGYFKEAEFHISYSQAAIELNQNGMSGLQAEVPLNNELIQKISTLDGVKKVEEIKSFGIRFDFPKKDEYGNHDVIYPMTENETKEIGKYLAEGSCDYDKLISGDYILVAGNNTVEEIYGWKFYTGDRITLHYYGGSRMEEREVTVLGILNGQYVLDNQGLEGWFLMPEQAILKLVSYNSLNAHLLVSVETDREAEIGDAIAQMVSEKPELSLETLEERRIVYGQIANQIFGAISGLAIFIMMFSILSMMNTLITNIVTRKQELAMLESIGMGKSQIRKMLLGESLLLAFVTVGVTMTIGTACGYVLSHTLYQRGAFYMEFKFPAAFALAYTGVLIFVPLIIIFVTMSCFSKEALVERLRGTKN